MGPYIDRCVPVQIMSNQLNLPQVDSNQVVEYCLFFSLFSPISILSHCCNSPTGRGEAKVESCILRNMTRQTALLITRPAAPMCQRKHHSNDRHNVSNLIYVPLTALNVSAEPTAIVCSNICLWTRIILLTLRLCVLAGSPLCAAHPAQTKITRACLPLIIFPVKQEKQSSIPEKC